MTINGGDTAWVLICAALVLFMTPGLAFFYAGLARRGNVLVMLQQNFVPLGVIGLTWVFFGHSIAFGQDVGGGLFGNLGAFALRDLSNIPSPALHVVEASVAIPALAFVAYQMTFAIIAPALATGATADRLKFAGWVAFLAVWSIIVYPPIAHWLFSPQGWLAKLGAQDWAGGMVVHSSAGAAALALLVVVGKRAGWPKKVSLPQSVPLAVIGAGILWFGWFGFNAGDGLQANGVAAQALLNTNTAAAAGMLLWLLMERITSGHSTVLGGVTGAVAGLATITPAAGYVGTVSAALIGAVAGIVCHLALRLKFIFKYDDALDVIAVHLVGGAFGSLLVGLFSERAVNSAAANGLFFGGGLKLLGLQALSLIVVLAYSFTLTWIIAMVIEKTIGLRVPRDQQDDLDRRQQGAAAYHFGLAAGLKGSGAPLGSSTPAQSGRAAAASSGEDVRLVTGWLKPVDADDLRTALMDAGALSIILSEARVYDQPESHVVRGYERQVEFPPRLRVEVLVEAQNVDATLRVLDRFAPSSRGIVQITEPVAAVT